MQKIFDQNTHLIISGMTWLSSMPWFALVKIKAQKMDANRNSWASQSFVRITAMALRLHKAAKYTLIFKVHM